MPFFPKYPVVGTISSTLKITFEQNNTSMKIANLIFAGAMILSSLHIQAQEIKKEPVKLTNPGGRSVHLFADYFNEGITKTILKQISREKLEEVKIYSEEENYPDCVKDALAYNPADTSSSSSAENIFLEKLKIYRIAKYDNIRNGENFGEESILVVPAAENKNAGGNCSFEKDFYIIIYTKDLELIK